MPRDVTIPALDAHPLAATLHEPSSGPVGTVVVAPAMAVPRGFYDAFAAFLASEGFRAVTFDYRGIGDSRRARAVDARARVADWGERDLAGVIEWAARSGGDAPVLLVGHSMGGQLAGLAPNHALLAGVLAVASTHLDWRNWPAPDRWGMWLLWHAVPAVVQVAGHLPGRMGLGEDVPPAIARDWARWGRSPEYAFVDDAAERRARYAAFRAPVRAVSLAGDRYAPRTAVERLLAVYANAPREHVRVEDAAVGHFGFFRPRHRDPLWHEAAEWLRLRSARIKP